MEMARSSISPDPLGIFPIIVWEKILGKLEDSSDIINVFKVFPVLDGLVLKNKFEWLIDQVAPLIFPKLDKVDVLNCRLVSTRWANGFDTFLDNWTPDILFQGLSHTTEPQQLAKEASRAYMHFKSELGYDPDWSDEPNRFDKSGRFEALERQMERHPPARNPFIGRNIILSQGVLQGNERDCYWSAAINFLRKYGDHVYHLGMCGAHRDFNSACQVLIKSLSLLPNLKTLQITGQSGFLFTRADVDEFPPVISLPHLEMLNLYELPEDPTASSINHFLIKRYSTQIRKLAIGFYNWREEFSQLFLNLTELNWLGVRNCEDVRNALASLRTPKLLKLKLDMDITNEEFNYFKWNVGSWLQPFPQIISLVMLVRFLSRSSVLTAETRCIPTVSLSSVSVTSLKSFSINCIKLFCGHELDESANFEYLQCFPNLEYIDINFRTHRPEVFDFQNVDQYYGPKIWEMMLPKLRELNLGRFFYYKCFTRDRYEWLAKMRSQSSTDVDLEELFETFNQMLTGNWGSDEEELIQVSDKPQQN